MENTNLMEDFILMLKMRGLRPLSIEYYRSYVSRFLDVTHCSLDDLGHEERLEKAYSKLWKRDISNDTRKKYLKCIRIFSDFLVKRGIIPENQARIIKCPRVQSQLPTCFDDGEIADIFDAIDDYWGSGRDIRGHSNHWMDQWNIAERNRIIVIILLYTGMRRNELVELRIEDCHEKEIFIREGKGGKSRMIYIPEWLGKMIQEYIKLANPCEFLINGRNIDDKIQPRTINTIFQKIRKITGLNIYSHKFRHTYATDRIKEGVNLHTIQRQLGHANISTTSLYFSISDKDREFEMQSVKKRGYI